MTLRCVLAAISVAVLTSCSSSTPPTPSAGAADPAILSSTTNTGVVTDEMIGRSQGAERPSRQATDPAYAYSEKAPVMVGGGFGSGSKRTYRFLNALRGPNGEAVTYSRVGTCCPFKSPNSPFDGEALLEVFAIRYAGQDHAQRLYFNWYDEGEVLVPLGLTATE